MSNHKYGVRYSVGEWGKEIPKEGREGFTTGGAGVINSNNEYGYTDMLFWASFLFSDDEKEMSIAMGCTQDPTYKPSRDVLMIMKNMIDKYLQDYDELPDVPVACKVVRKDS